MKNIMRLFGAHAYRTFNGLYLMDFMFIYKCQNLPFMRSVYKSVILPFSWFFDSVIRKSEYIGEIDEKTNEISSFEFLDRYYLRC